MNRAPFDSRSCEEKSPRGDKDKPSTMPSLRTENPVKLQPAPIPLVNPWNRKQSVTSDHQQAFPPLPLLLSTDTKNSTSKNEPVNPSTDTLVSTNGKITKKPRASSVSSLSATSRNSIRPSTSRTESPASTASLGSKQSLRAAASRAAENLWIHPFGTDVVVQSRSLSFQIHRNIVQEESGWLRENLPPPNLDGTPVELFIDLAAEPVGHCLRFLYTQRMEVCEPQEAEPWNVKHLPCCVLAYCAAVVLQIPKLAVYLLRIVEETAEELDHQIITEYAYENPTHDQLYGFCCHYYNAMEILNHQGPKRLMKPIRLAMAKVANSTFFWLIRHPGFPHTLSTNWAKVLPSISLDQIEYRRISSLNRDMRKSIVPKEAALQQMFAEASENDS